MAAFAALALVAGACSPPADESQAEGAPAGAPAAAQAPPALDSLAWARVAEAMGRTGTLQPGGVYRFGMPRGDLRVTSQGVQIRPALSLGSWLAMTPSGNGQVVAMGDLVLTEDELNPVLAHLQENGVGQTAIHKHLLGEEPALWWTHIHGHGDPLAVATAVSGALALTGTPPAPSAGTPAAPAPAIELDTARIHQVLGIEGRVNGGVYQVSVPRAETIRSMGVVVGPPMGTGTAINFQPTGGGRAAINGDFVMTPGEVDAVIATLRENGISVVSLHNHLLDEEPRLAFMHFWGHDDAVRLALGLRAALERTNSSLGGGAR